MDNGAGSYRRFLDGDNEGFVEIVRDYKDGLILYLNSIVTDITEAEDLAEDTFVKLGVRRPVFSGKSSFRTWLYAIGRNVAIDHLRKESRHRTEPIDRVDGAEDIETLEDAYIREEQKIGVHRAMAALKPEYRQVLWLTYFEGFSSRETAMIMRKTVHGIETLSYRARQSLKKVLEEGSMYEII
ncbi:MAG: RNA polymerase sigma factor [Oscillospiraceae bacterium]|nr:RNA polymerase sigma factor [Oscillospiraceae bacterium]